MKERETEKIALGEEEATRPETRPKERCNMDGCEYQSDGVCHYYEATGSIRPCVPGVRDAGTGGRGGSRWN